jgi:hypothetical protein
MSALGVKPLVISAVPSKSPRATHRLPSKLQHSPYVGQGPTAGTHDLSPSITSIGNGTSLSSNLILQRPSNVIGGQRRLGNAPPLILDGNLMFRQSDGVHSGSQSYRMAGLGNREQSPAGTGVGGPSG